MAAIEVRPAEPVSTGRGRSRGEQELILRAQRYEPEALEQLFDAHVEELFRYVDTILGDPAGSEEIVRLTWQRALEGLPRYRRFDAGFETWLQRIANSLIAQASMPAAEEPEDRLRAAIRRLTADQLDVITLRFFAGLSIEEIARATGRSRVRVVALQHRGMLALLHTETT
ncbi:MAG TPA: sigma factor-like helix-turn-helix DNA-binding protein [Candidatus Dormibacteraeota bacterium]|nr:sigma factor-like helix-turn-helix DNA-binding protein [Candidatus Dormibacteraeota bacterium]